MIVAMSMRMIVLVNVQCSKLIVKLSQMQFTSLL